MNKNISFATGLALGGALMYVFDPDSGRRRRALVRDRATRLSHKTTDGLAATARDLSNRAAGSVAEVRSRFRADEPSDGILVERVRAELGRAVSHAAAIDVEAHKGTVRLCGPILTREMSSLLRAVESVPGVRRIDNQLEAHDQPGNIPSLQGAERRL